MQRTVTPARTARDRWARRRREGPGSQAPERPLRILYPASLGLGGAERQLTLLAKHMPRDRFDLTFVVLGGATPLADEIRRSGRTVLTLGTPRRAGLSLPMLAAHGLKAVVNYASVSRRGRYDIVDAWLYHGYWLAGVTRPVGRVPFLIAGRRSLSAFKERWNPLWRLIDEIARRRTDRYVANSQAVSDDVQRRERIDPSRIRVIRNGVEIPDLADVRSKARARALLGVPDDALVVGCVGSFKRGKGQVSLLRSMPEVVRQVDRAFLVIAGDGPERASAERTAAELGVERVRFLGNVPDARALYPAFDVLVSASEAEGLPNVVLEAAAAGRPIVATDAGGTREIIEDGVSGVLVAVGDEAALARGVVQLLLDPALGARLGLAAREHAAAAFGIDRLIAETAALYEESARR